MHKLTTGVMIAGLTLAACGGTGSGAADAAASSGDAGAAACGVTDDGDSVTLAVGDTPPAGGSVTTCVSWTTPRALDVSQIVGTLGPAAGHHALLLVRDPDGADGVFPCSEPELMDAAERGEFQMLAGVSYESDGVTIAFPSVPVQVGLRIPAGKQLVLDAHFLNSGDTSVDACASITLGTGRPVVAPLTFMTLLPAVQYDLVVPAGQSLDVDYAIPVTARVRVAAATTHMHVGGTHARLSAVPAVGDAVILHETNEYTGGEPTLHDGAAIVVDTGDAFRLECSFTNGGAAEQRFPDQMCVGGLYVLPCSLPGACPL